MAGKGIGKRGFITLIEVMILILVLTIFATLPSPGFSRARPQARKKACVSNMKTIEGATELYLMERTIKASRTLDQATLKSGGYLKTELVCPANGNYTIRISPAKGDTSGTCDIKCNIHQGIDDTTSGL